MTILKFNDGMAHTLLASSLTDIIPGDATEHDIDLLIIGRILSKTHSSGWRIIGKIEADWYIFVCNFTAHHPEFGSVSCSPDQISATSQDALDNFLQQHPLEVWDWDDI